MTWLEPTQKCNITCDACFVENRATSEKSLDQIRYELEFMMRSRRCDAMLIAGGEPLTHPRIVDIVRLTKETGAKPVLITNGVALDRSLVRELKKAGAHGFTLHVDSHQNRPGWTGKSEAELNVLRLQYADLLYEEGGLTCAFNTTIFPDTLAAVPDIVEWAIGLPERVHVLTLICVRMLEPGAPYDYYVGDRQVDIGLTPYVSSEKYENLMAEDIYREIKRVLPDFEFCSYLGGTVNPQALKWVIGCRIGTGARSYGHMGPRSMEILQNVHHAFRNRYLAFNKPRTSGSGRLALLLGFFDPDVRRAALRFLGAGLRNPVNLFGRVHIQGISVVQPVDVLSTGETDTCDGCPNATFWQDRLVSACRAEEYRKFGGPVRLVPRQTAVNSPGHEQYPHSR
jgi:hypothetical protein